MLWIQLISLMLVTVSCTAKEEENANEIIVPPPPINLDSNLRRALLKALTELENEENAKIKENEQTINHHLPHIDISDKIVEKASASALSFYTQTGKSTISTTETVSSSTTEEETERPVVIIQRSSGIQSKPITSIERSPSDAIDPYNDAEQILTSASSSFAGDKFSYKKSESNQRSSSTTANLNSVTDNSIKSITKTTKSIPKEVTTILPTTSTEESEAKVEDVQFFSAPLVAAFTVHQDETGLPKSVVPIYKQTQNTANKNQINLHEKLKQDQLRQQQLVLQQQQILAQPSLTSEQYKTHLVLQEKQRALEEEILRLKQQQQQQEYLLRQQQILHEQQLNAARSREQIRIQNNQQPFVPITTPPATLNKQFENNQNFRNQFNSNESRAKGTVLSFQPSITLEQANRLGSLPLNGQILPVKGAVDFRSSSFFNGQKLQQFPSLITEQRPPLVQNVPTFNIVQSFEPPSPLVQVHSNRVFRHESGVGNFGTNNFDAGFNSNFFGNQHQQSHPNSNRFFRSNLESSHFNNFNRVQPPVFNQQLNNLLYNSGLIHGRQEDFNIVSKVLSLNHLGGDYQFANSNINVQRVPAPSTKKV